MQGLADEKSLMKSSNYSLLEMEQEHSETFQDSWQMSEYLLVLNPDKPVYNKVVEENVRRETVSPRREQRAIDKAETPNS